MDGSELCSPAEDARLPSSQGNSKSESGKLEERYAEEQEEPLLRPTALDSETAAVELQSPDRRALSTLQDEGVVNATSILTRINWHLLPIFFLLAMLCSIDRANLSFAAIQLKHDLSFSDSTYGLGSGIFFVGYAVLSVPSTVICSKFGAPTFLGVTLIAWGGVAMLFAIMRSEWQFLLLRFVLGLAESGAYPGMWFQLALFYTELELGLAYTVVSTASALSGVAGAPLAACLLKLDGFLHLYGWQWLFLLEGFPAILLGIVVLHHLARTPETASFLTPSEQAWLLSRKEGHAERSDSKQVDEEGQLVGTKTELGALVVMLREGRVWWLGGVWAIVSVGMDGLVFWIPLLIQGIMYGEDDEEGESYEDEMARTTLKGRAVHIALLSAVPFSAAALGMLVVAHKSKCTGERRWHIAVPLVVATAAMAALPLVEGRLTWLAFSFLTIGAVGIWAPHGPLLSWPAAFLDGTTAASGFALIKMLGSLAAFGGNATIGWLHETTGTFALPVLLLACLLAIGAVLALAFPDPGGRENTAISPFLKRLQGRMAMKRSRSDPTSFYPSRTYSGSLSTIREHIARPDHSLGRFEMPSIHTDFLEGRQVPPVPGFTK